MTAALPKRRHPRSRRRRPAARLLALLGAAALALAGLSVAAPTAGADTSFTFNGGGWGHGVGMSQWGARGMAAQGKGAGAILRHYYSGTAISTRAGVSDLRVLMGTGPSFTLTTGGTTSFSQFGAGPFATLPGGRTVTLTRTGDSVRASGGATGTVSGAMVIGFAGSGLLRVSPPNRRYAYGTLVVSPNPGGGLRAVLVGLTMQQYLYGLGEVPSSWPNEALRAQAIAGRTFAMKIATRANRWSSDFDLHSGNPHQTYLGWEKEGGSMGDRWRAAVDSSKDLVVTYAGALIDAVYSASSGGRTENSETVWVSAVPYLRSVADAADLTGGNPNGAWSRTYTGSQLGSWFGVGRVTAVQVLGPLGASGRVDKATIRLVGTGGTKEMTGASFRSWLNAASPSSQLMSTKFTVGAGSTGTPGGTATAFGVLDVARADGRTIVIGGRALDPDGPPLVRVVSTMGTTRAVRETRPVGGHFLVAWDGPPGTRNVCVSLVDTPTGAEVGLGCRSVTVK